ncbi:bacterial regulatory helix-turn-helix, lysR family protein, partial [Vibrio parahaemolyticus V-223/04]
IVDGHQPRLNRGKIGASVTRVGLRPSTALHGVRRSSVTNANDSDFPRLYPTKMLPTTRQRAGNLLSLGDKSKRTNLGILNPIVLFQCFKKRRHVRALQMLIQGLLRCPNFLEHK